MSEYQHFELTKEIIGTFYDVYNMLGYGFLEKVYENALAIELGIRGFQVEQQKPIAIHFRNQIIGEYFADILVNGLIILELKATRALVKDHEAQLLNYLKATPYEVGLLLNFGPQPSYKRKAFSNHNKPTLTNK
ncbi:MAG: GxxExxY protein [Anaerolineaceae bacterium]|nr:GxxExxY protein [Anaerolineaceae bacterium]